MLESFIGTLITTAAVVLGILGAVGLMAVCGGVFCALFTYFLRIYDSWVVKHREWGKNK